MPLFDIDPDRCVRDGICVETCPMRIIEMAAADAPPSPTTDAEATCIDCGHCMAVCPTGALSLKTMPAAQSPPVHQDWRLPVERVEHLLRSRRSIRTYTETIVPRADLQRLIEMARHAPSGHNRQPVHWLVLQEPAEVRRVAGIVIDYMRYLLAEHPEQAAAVNLQRVVDGWGQGHDTICRGAPHVIVAHAPADERTAPAAGTLALGYLELAAPSLGIGTCWAGYLNWAATMWPPMRDALQLPADHAPYGALLAGYPRFGYHRLPERKAPPITWR